VYAKVYCASGAEGGGFESRVSQSNYTEKGNNPKKAETRQYAGLETFLRPGGTERFRRANAQEARLAKKGGMERGCRRPPNGRRVPRLSFAIENISEAVRI
jgi:hypothetical protein